MRGRAATRNRGAGTEVQTRSRAAHREAGGGGFALVNYRTPRGSCRGVGRHSGQLGRGMGAGSSRRTPNLEGRRLDRSTRSRSYGGAEAPVKASAATSACPPCPAAIRSRQSGRRPVIWRPGAGTRRWTTSPSAINRPAPSAAARQPARYKVAAPWTDGTRRELKNIRPGLRGPPRRPTRPGPRPARPPEPGRGGGRGGRRPLPPDPRRPGRGTPQGVTLAAGGARASTPRTGTDPA